MREVDPMTTGRAASWAAFIDAPMPMVTIFKTLDITNLLRLKAEGWKLNMLLCFCVGRAAAETPEFRLLPVGKRMMEYDELGVNVIAANRAGGISSCDLPALPMLTEFSRVYAEGTAAVYESCRDRELGGRMIVGTSALVDCDIDGVVNMYSGVFNNPFLIWGRYREESGRTTLRVSFQFHHVQMDGREACAFLERLQRHISGLAG